MHQPAHDHDVARDLVTTCRPRAPPSRRTLAMARPIPRGVATPGLGKDDHDHHSHQRSQQALDAQSQRVPIAAGEHRGGGEGDVVAKGMLLSKPNAAPRPVTSARRRSERTNQGLEVGGEDLITVPVPDPAVAGCSAACRIASPVPRGRCVAPGTVLLRPSQAQAVLASRLGP